MLRPCLPYVTGTYICFGKTTGEKIGPKGRHKSTTEGLGVWQTGMCAVTDERCRSGCVFLCMWENGTWEGRAIWCTIISNGSVVPNSCGEEGAESEGKRSRLASGSIQTLTCGHELRVRTSDIWRVLRVQLLVIHFKRSQLSWSGYLIMMPSGCVSLEIIQPDPAGRGPQGTIHSSLEGLSHLAWEYLRIPLKELESTARQREQLGCCASPTATTTPPKISRRY